MAEKSAKTARVQAVKNENGSSDFGCYAINGKEAYGVKTKDRLKVSTIYYFPDFQKPYTKTYKVENGLLGHGNGMCCAKNTYFYMLGKKGRGRETTKIFKARKVWKAHRQSDE